jgi:hypothetical protein
VQEQDEEQQSAAQQQDEEKRFEAQQRAAQQKKRQKEEKKEKKEMKKEKREKKNKIQVDCAAASGDADVPCILYPLTFVGVAGSAVGTEEKKEKKQHTATPTTAASFKGPSPLVADGTSTGTQGEEKPMARLGCGPPACAVAVASLRRVAPGAHDPRMDLFSRPCSKF